MVSAASPSTPGSDYPVDRRTCRLLGPTALVVQFLLGVLVILSLIYKRQREKPKRPWKIWIFDVSKQIVGQILVHLSNVFISDLVAHHESKNPCVLYFLNILVDTTFGIGIMYIVLTLTSNLLTSRFHLKGFQSGSYGDPRHPSLKFWGRQAAVYCFALFTMKLAVIGLFGIWPGIFKVGRWLLSWTGDKDSVQVIVVMGIIPIVLNILQFWLIDSIVKASSSLVELLPNIGLEEAEEPLVGSDESDDGSGENAVRHSRESLKDLENSSRRPTGRLPGSPTPHVPSENPRPHSQRVHSYPPEPLDINSPSTPLRSATSTRDSEWGWNHQGGYEDGQWRLDGDPWGKKITRQNHSRTTSRDAFTGGILSPTALVGS